MNPMVKFYDMPFLLRCVLMTGILEIEFCENPEWARDREKGMFYALRVLVSLGLLNEIVELKDGQSELDWEYSETFLELCKQNCKVLYAHRQVAIDAAYARRAEERRLKEEVE
jgi:hypothetical protein